ncbi:MAG: dienelactone hydrolase [Rubritalea sp.]|jgi:dienelactone hydrolase
MNLPITTKGRILSSLVILLTSVSSQADDFANQRKEVEALAKLTKAPVVQAAERFSNTESVKPIYFDGLDWQGKPTKVFAWLGLPKNPKGKVPGVVLVHGGGGTAFKLWVEKWNTKGYAAISIAVEGQTDVKAKKGQPAIATKWSKHQWSGPERKGIYNDSKPTVEITDQWMYHAVADTILANSLLRSLPEVDADKVGLMGISWGGVITSTVIGIDDRFAFAIPTYGCGDLTKAQNQYGKSLGKNETYKQVWDPMLRLEKVETPTLWFSWPEDKHFPMNHFAACYKKVKGPYMVSLIPILGHGHGPPWNKEDSYAFADSVVKQERVWCRQTNLKKERNMVEVSFASAKPLQQATLVSTKDKGVSGLRKWTVSTATIKKEGNQWIAQTSLPHGTTAWFINVSNGKLTASSDYQEE